MLLVGETGVGKSSVLEFIANVLAGNDIDNYNFDFLDHTNERGGPDNQSQTKSARLYEFTSKNDIALRVVTCECGECAQRLPKVRILGVPGLVDTRSAQQDELHKQSVET